MPAGLLPALEVLFIVFAVPTTIWMLASRRSVAAQAQLLAELPAVQVEQPRYTLEQLDEREAELARRRRRRSYTGRHRHPTNERVSRREHRLARRVGISITALLAEMPTHVRRLP